MTDLLLPGGADACARPAPSPGGRFQPGHTGNPKGGPKRPAPRTAEIEWLFNQTFTVEIDGEGQRLPLARALLLAMAHRALKGDARAANELLALYGKAEETRAAQAAARTRKATEAKVAKAEEQATPEVETYLDFSSTKQDDALKALGVLGEPNRWGMPYIRRRAFEALTAADPGLLPGLTPHQRRAVTEHLDDDDWPDGEAPDLGIAEPPSCDPAG